MFSVTVHLGIVHASHTQYLYYGYVSQLWTKAEGDLPYLKAEKPLIFCESIKECKNMLSFLIFTVSGFQPCDIIYFLGYKCNTLTETLAIFLFLICNV